MKHLTLSEMEAGLEEIRQSPRDEGVLQMIVRRPESNEREVIEEGRLDVAQGLIGDTWSRSPGSADCPRQAARG